MELSEFKDFLSRENLAKKRMAEKVLSQLDEYRNELQEIKGYYDQLVDSKGNKIEVGIFKIGLFKTHDFDYKGETNGIVYLDMDEGRIAIDIRDDSRDILDSQYDLPKLLPEPVELTSELLASCIAENNNFEMAMQATNPNTLMQFAVKNAKKEINNVNTRINEFN